MTSKRLEVLENSLAKKNEELEKTFDIYFEDENYCDNKGFELTLQEAMNYIKTYNGTNDSYFEDYKGGMVQIVDNKDRCVIYEEEII